MREQLSQNPDLNQKPATALKGTGTKARGPKGLGSIGGRLIEITEKRQNKEYGMSAHSVLGGTEVGMKKKFGF